MKWDEMWNEIKIFAIIELIALIALNELIALIALIGKPLLLLCLFSLMNPPPIIDLIQHNGTY